MYNFRPSRGLVERRIGNAQPDSVFNVFDVQQFYLAIDISNLAFLSSTCSVYFMRPQIRRPAALEVSRKGEKYESDGVKRLPPETNLRINRESSRDFNKLRLPSFIIAFDRVFFFFFFTAICRRISVSATRPRRFCNIVNFIKTYKYIYMSGLPFLRIDDYCQCIYPTGRLTHRSI